MKWKKKVQQLNGYLSVGIFRGNEFRGELLIDNDDYELFRTRSIRINKEGYPIVNWISPEGKRQPYELHRILYPANAPLCVDHQDRNRLNNRRANLRHITMQENLLNSDISEAARLRRANRPKWPYRPFGTGSIAKHSTSKRLQVKVGAEYLGLVDSVAEGEKLIAEYRMCESQKGKAA